MLTRRLCGQKTKRAIGAFLMDQSMIAGIGNIYRSELLLVAGIHPDHPACSVSRSSFESLWIQAKRLFEIGVQTGYIITILTDDAGNPLPTVRGGIQSGSFVYNQKECGVCGGIVFRWTINQRAVFACQACQPPPPTVAGRKVACIPSTRLGGRDYTLEIEDLAVLENLNTAVKTSKYWSMMNSFLLSLHLFPTVRNSKGFVWRVNNLYLCGLATGRQLPKVVEWWSIRPSSTSILVASLKHLRFPAYLQVLRTPKIHRIMHWQK
jgi:hypothetical protein